MLHVASAKVQSMQVACPFPLDRNGPIIHLSESIVGEERVKGRVAGGRVVRKMQGMVSFLLNTINNRDGRDREQRALSPAHVCLFLKKQGGVSNTQEVLLCVPSPFLSSKAKGGEDQSHV